MKKTNNLIKVIAGLVACFVLVIGNPLKTQAGWWDCFCGRHRVVTTFDRGTCATHPTSKSYCADCGQCMWIEIDYSRSGPHCYSTNPYEAPVCLICGHRK